MRKNFSVRAAILDAAIHILQESGIKSLTQPKIAKAVGIRQSHLTYYFPKKYDLIAALLQQHLNHAEVNLEQVDAEDVPGALAMIVQDPRRMRFFLGLIVEAQHDASLKNLVDEHIAQFDAKVAAYYDRDAGDEEVAAFLSTLRGFGMCSLARNKPAHDIDIERLAKRFGLRARRKKSKRPPA